MYNYEKVPPRADAMIASMRAMGYDLPMAIADLIDNSIYTKARNIWIKYQWSGQNSWTSILDDGLGMTENRPTVVMDSPGMIAPRTLRL